jgi:hypothetical protein
MRFKIHDYLTEEGQFDEERFAKNVQTVMKHFESKEYYKDRAWVNMKKEKTN